MKPFLDCLPIESDRWVKAFQVLSECRKADVGEGLKPRNDVRQPDIINAPDYQEEHEIEISKEMSRAPKDRYHEVK